ncbi:hypothetical protein FGRA07_07575 [Fusarium graminearum]|nr:hypothetical protein FGRA07_07575 [Fusarium graminearum]
MVASKLILAAIAFGPVAAGPCRPSPTKVLSSTTDFSSSSMISLSDSSLSSRPTHDASTSKELSPETTTNIAADTSLISITVTFESTTTIPTDSQGTVADATSDIKTETTAEGTSTMETTPTNDIASTTLESTTEGSGSASTATVTTGTATTEPTTTIAESTVESESTAAAWFTSYSTAPLSYDPITRHLLLGDKRLCLMYDSITIASFAICQGPPVGQKFELTCDDPSDGSLRCNIPAKQYISKDNIFVDTGDTWSHFYLLEVNRQFSPGVFRIIIAKDNLSNNDIKYAAFERITVGTMKV